jgi:hypothetical protein
VHHRAPGKVKAIAATSLLLSLGLSACDAITIRTTKQQDFLNEIRRVYPQLKQKPDTQLLQTGSQVCGWLDTGQSVVEVHDELVRNGMSDEAASIWVLVPATKLCPEHAPPTK